MRNRSAAGSRVIFGKLLCKVIAAFKGDDYRSAFVDNMAFGGYNKRFEPARTDKDWLTRDEKRGGRLSGESMVYVPLYSQCILSYVLWH